MILFRKDREQQILDLFKKGDKCAMDKLYQEYADHMAGVCARYISDEDNLKDVLQESFIKIFTQIHLFDYRGKGSLKAGHQDCDKRSLDGAKKRPNLPCPASGNGGGRHP